MKIFLSMQVKLSKLYMLCIRIYSLCPADEINRILLKLSPQVAAWCCYTLCHTFLSICSCWSGSLIGNTWLEVLFLTRREGTYWRLDPHLFLYVFLADFCFMDPDHWIVIGILSICTLHEAIILTYSPFRRFGLIMFLYITASSWWKSCTFLFLCY